MGGIDVVVTKGDERYTVQTLSSGCAALELPLGEYDLLYYNPSTGEFRDGTMKVVPPSPNATGPQKETVVFFPNTSRWSLEQTDAEHKHYDHAQLKLYVYHENYSAMATTDARWFRENVRYPADPERSFEDGYDAAADDDHGPVDDLGPWLPAADTHDHSSRTFFLEPLRNGRYWVQLHYKGVNTGRDIFHVAYVDVDNIYTPVPVYVRDYDETNDTVAKPHTPLSSNQNRVGIARDLDGTALVEPSLGYDTITYTRNEKMPAPRWEMIVPGAPFAVTSEGASSSVITLNPEALGTTNRPEDSETGLYYTVKYRDTTPPYTITYDPNGGIGKPYVEKLGVNFGHTSALAYGLDLVKIKAPEDTLFTGWNTKADGTGDSYTPGSWVSVSGSMTLYAQWKSTVTTVTVSNTIDGLLGDKTRAFSFSIWLYDVAGKPISGSLPTTQSDAPLEVISGQGTFTLTHGQKIIIGKLPIDGQVRVLSDAPSDYSVSFIDSVQGETPIIGRDTGTLPMGLDRAFSFLGTRETPPDTGLTSGDVNTTLLMPAVIVLLTVPLFSLACFVVRRRVTGRS